MTRSRFALLLTIGLLVLAVLVAFFTRDQISLQVFSATIQRDCAPWDGGAFTLKIPMHDGTSIDVSIWQSPDLPLPKYFSFPDESMQMGNALLVHPSGLPEPLTGKVYFQRVKVGTPVEGRFSFTTERGRQSKGQFHAEWDDQVILCG